MNTIQRLKIPIALLLVVALLLVSGIALAQVGGPGPASGYAVQPGASSGGSYQLASLAWQVSGTAAGGSYALVSPSAPTLRGSGCCCTYLPCILRNW